MSVFYGCFLDCNTQACVFLYIYIYIYIYIKYIYIYIYIKRKQVVNLQSYIKVIDYGESGSMIEICGRLDKSNTYTGLVVSVIFHFLFQESLG